MPILVVLAAALLFAVAVVAVAVVVFRRQLVEARAQAARDHETLIVALERERAELAHTSNVALNQAMETLVRLTDERLSARGTDLDRQLSAKAAEVDQQFALRSESFDKQVGHLTSGLHEVATMVARLQKDRAHQHGELVQRLSETARTTNELALTTRGLREALASPKARGQWGERMAEDVLQAAGFVADINYRRQRATAEGSVPDFTFLLPRGLELNMDVKFPIDNYLRFLEAENAGEQDQLRAAFARDVRNRVKEIVGRSYIDPERTVDYVLLFIPNESVYGFLHENDRELADLALRHKVVLCSPFTLFAVLGVIRQAIDQFQLERTSDEILQCLGRFSKQWREFSESLDKVDRHLSTLNNSVEALSGRRRRMLEKELARIDDLRQSRGLLDDDEQRLARAPLREIG